MTTPDDAGTPAPDDTPRYGQRAPHPPADPTPPAGSTPGHGGPPQSGQPDQAPPNAWGPPQHGQYGQPGPSQYGQPQYGQPQYGQPQYGQPAQHGGPGHPGYGPPSFAGKPYAPPADKPGIIPLRPLSLGEIFDGAFGAIRTNPQVMLGMSAIVIAVATVAGMGLGALLSGILAPLLVESEASLGTDAEIVNTFSTLYVSTLTTTATLALAIPIVNGLLITSVGQAVIGRKATPSETWAQARSKIWSLIGFSLLSGTVVFLSLLLYIGIIVLLAQVSGAAALVVGLLGGFALIALYLWFSVRILLVPPALVLEGQGFRSAVGRGWRLSRGVFWRTLGIYLLASLAVGLIASLIAQPLALVAGMLAVWSPVAMFAVTALAQIVSGVMTTVFLAGVVSLLYIDVRMRREGLDVELTAAAATNEHGAV